MWTSIHGSPILNWLSHCRSNTSSTRAILGNYASTLGQCPWRTCRSASGGEATPPHPYKLLELVAGSLLHRQETFCLSTKSWGQIDIFPLAVGARSPQQLQTFITFSCHLWCSHMTTLLSFMFHVDVDGHLTCPIQASIKEVMPLQTFAVSGATPRPLLL